MSYKSAQCENTVVEAESRIEVVHVDEEVDFAWLTARHLEREHERIPRPDSHDSSRGPIISDRSNRLCDQ